MLSLQPSDFSRLAAVAGLVSLDLSPKPLTLRLEGGRLWAVYSGTYIRGEVGVAYEGGADEGAFPGTFGARQFDQVASILGTEAPITLHGDAEGSLHVGNGQLRLTLRPASEEPEPLLGGPATVLFTATCGDLRGEVDLATDFCAKTTSAPLFTGVRLLPSASGIAVMAFDGFSGMFASLAAGACVDKFDITIPGYDLSLGLKVMDSETVTCGWLHGPGGHDRIAFKGEHAVFHCSPLHGTWPDLRPLTLPVERYSVTVPAEHLKAAVASAKLLLADNSIALEEERGTVYLRTAASEQGRFEAPVTGSFPAGLAALFDINNLKLASQLGGDVQLAVAADVAKPTFVQSGRRRYWIARRVR